jgi:uncharacterized integral membrane protein
MPLVYLLIVVFALAVAVFALQNAAPVRVSFLVWESKEAPLAAVILISVAAGVVLVSLIGFVQRWKLRTRIRRLESQLRPGEPTPPQA